jgi:predicted RNA-binding protein with PUA-like domain
MMNYWLIKSEPFKYPYEQLEKDGITFWDGVRNFQARNNLMAMQPGDLCLYYHSNEGKEIVAIAKVVRAHYPDPTAEADSGWVVVDVAPFKRLKKPVTLQDIKADDVLKNMALVKQSRLSVMPVTKDEFDRVLLLGS